MTHPTILLAPDKFKGSLDAADVAHHLAEGIRDEDPRILVRRSPIADGGEGTVAAALAAGWSARRATVEGPTGLPVEATYAVDGARAVIELAESCGLQRLPAGRLAPWAASTYGLGQIIAAAVDAGATEVIVGLGGSASTDGGAGVLQALGGMILDRNGESVGRGARHLGSTTTIDLSAARARLAGVRIVAACDVTNPLLGPEGAAHVFGPQKGLRSNDLLVAEAGLDAFARAVCGPTRAGLSSVPGAGAAGGTGFALLALGATFRPGIDVVADLIGLEEQISLADLVVVGEGSLDVQSLAGKGPLGVARLAGSLGVPVIAVVGRNCLSPAQAAGGGLMTVLDLISLDPDPDRCVRYAPELLRRTGGQVARLARDRCERAPSLD
ncbi:glycerate kinase [Nocardioides sp. YR527]|uniref:glycerate kinase n=1 Tax=Nocardioides sp. YR527 TaxID=1881028 RepID=UPI0008923CA4|nr:glycerate kinase [Nocardioides sp. YR527]SDK69987.1 glycerate kinase [Nocardioides sp. YR527]